jgi:hypothetical protein
MISHVDFFIQKSDSAAQVNSTKSLILRRLGIGNREEGRKGGRDEGELLELTALVSEHV